MSDYSNIEKYRQDMQNYQRQIDAVKKQFESWNNGDVLEYHCEQSGRFYCPENLSDLNIIEEKAPNNAKDGRIYMGYYPQKITDSPTEYIEAVDNNKAQKTGNFYTLFYPTGPKKFAEYLSQDTKRYFIVADSFKTTNKEQQKCFKNGKMVMWVEPVQWELKQAPWSGEYVAITYPCENCFGFSEVVAKQEQHESSTYKTRGNEMFQYHPTPKSSLKEAFKQKENADQAAYNSFIQKRNHGL